MLPGLWVIGDKFLRFVNDHANWSFQILARKNRLEELLLHSFARYPMAFPMLRTEKHDFSSCDQTGDICVMPSPISQYVKINKALNIRI